MSKEVKKPGGREMVKYEPTRSRCRISEGGKVVEVHCQILQNKTVRMTKFDTKEFISLESWEKGGKWINPLEVAKEQKKREEKAAAEQRRRVETAMAEAQKKNEARAKAAAAREASTKEAKKS